MSKRHTNNKSKLRAQTINRVLTVLCIVFLVYAVAVTGILIYTIYKTENTIDIVDVFNYATAAANQYQYASLTIDQGVFTEDQQYRAQYVTTAQKGDSYHTYMYRDSDDNALYQCWKLNDDESTYDAYVYANDYETWVKTSTQEEPLTVNIWDMFTYAGGYVLDEATYPWYDTQDPCYVLTRTATTSEWSGTYEEIYIRKSDFLPLGVILLYTDNNPDDLTHEDIQNGVATKIDEDLEVPETTTMETNQIIQKYSIVWSNEDLRLFDEPETFITDEEYLSLTETSEESIGEDSNNE